MHPLLKTALDPFVRLLRVRRICIRSFAASLVLALLAFLFWKLNVTGEVAAGFFVVAFCVFHFAIFAVGLKWGSSGFLVADRGEGGRKMGG